MRRLSTTGSLALPLLALSLIAFGCTQTYELGDGQDGASEPVATGGSGGAPAETPEAAPAEVRTWKAGDTIPSGRAGVPDIQILEVHANGGGEPCGTGRRASLKYKAMQHADGSVLDPGTRPFTFTIGAGEAISGWDVVVAEMRVGDSFTLVIPHQLAYGPGRGDLRFDMELLSVQ